MIIPANEPGIGPYAIFKKRKDQTWNRVCIVRGGTEYWGFGLNRAERWLESLQNGDEPGHSKDAEYCVFQLVWELVDD
jgi:hypothetical protein